MRSAGAGPPAGPQRKPPMQNLRRRQRKKFPPGGMLAARRLRKPRRRRIHLPRKPRLRLEKNLPRRRNRPLPRRPPRQQRRSRPFKLRRTRIRDESRRPPAGHREGLPAHAPHRVRGLSQNRRSGGRRSSNRNCRSARSASGSTFHFTGCGRTPHPGLVAGLTSVAPHIPLSGNASRTGRHVRCSARGTHIGIGFPRAPWPAQTAVELFQRLMAYCGSCPCWNRRPICPTPCT
jgi:hypothetical protein